MEYLKKVGTGGDYKYYFNLGKIFFNAKSYETAIENFTKALEDNPYLVDAYYLRALAYENIGKYKEAIEDLKKATMLMPEEKKFFTTMAKVYFKMAEEEVKKGNYKKAADYFIDGLTIDYNLKIDPEFEDVFERAAKECMEENNYLKAIQYLEFEDRVLTNLSKVN